MKAATILPGKKLKDTENRIAKGQAVQNGSKLDTKQAKKDREIYDKLARDVKECDERTARENKK